MKKIMTTLALVSALALTGCGPDEGTITQKHFDAGHEYTVKVCNVFIKGVCYGYRDDVRWDDDDYNFHLRDGDNEGWVEVPKDVYDSHDEGDFYAKN